MRKLAIVGIVLSGVLMSAAIAQAKPVGMSKAEYRALVIRSEGLNQKYGVGQQSQQALIREKLGEIGLWAVPSKPTARVTSSSNGFDWNNTGIGVGLIVGFVLLGLASLLTIRRHDRPVAH